MDERLVLESLGSHFEIDGKLTGFRQANGGHVHDTYIATYEVSGCRRRYVHQRISPVFADVTGLMSNVVMISSHLEKKLAEPGRSTPSQGQRALRVIKTRWGKHHWEDPDQRAWRTFEFIPGAHSCTDVDTPSQAYEIGAAFGNYLALLDDLGTTVGSNTHGADLTARTGATSSAGSTTTALVETIPRFHDLDGYLANLENSVTEDACARVTSAGVATTLEEVLRMRWIAREVRRKISLGDLASRPVHNDCKSANVLCDDITGEWVCVIDLDTTMNGYAMHDFGDIARTAATPAREDERDPELSRLDLTLFNAAARGYLEACAHLLSEPELDSLPLGAIAMAYEAAVRFLTDFLSGDTYFKVDYPDHNLVRCRAQLALANSMIKDADRMSAIVTDLQAF